VEQTRAARYRATVHYDGTGFHGWQVQPRVRTVQGAVEEALDEMDARAGRVVAAGRTDRGVHATAQEVAVGTGRRRSPGELLRGLNALLPEDVWVETLAECDDDFHPRFDARARRYEYLVAGPAGSRPLRRRRTWQPRRAPDPQRLEEIAGALPGRRSFETFAKSGQPERGTECHLTSARWDVTGPGDLRFTVVADRFLHRMVRYLVATMVEEATGRRSPGETARLLDDPEAGRPPSPAPPEGLYLTGVRFEEGWNRPPGIPGFAPAYDGPPRDRTGSPAGDSTPPNT
jgi:tRNA pseudouridine38-40 synthase